jgi:hypothetical protein
VSAAFSRSKSSAEQDWDQSGIPMGENSTDRPETPQGNPGGSPKNNPVVGNAVNTGKRTQDTPIEEIDIQPDEHPEETPAIAAGLEGGDA